MSTQYALCILGNMKSMETVVLIIDITTLVFVIYCMAMISGIKDNINNKPIIWQCEKCGAFNNIKKDQCGKCFEMKTVIRHL